MKYIIGVDIGTSGTKAVAFRDTGAVIAEHYAGYGILNPRPGYFEQPPEELFSAMVDTISAAVRKVNQAFDNAKLLGIGFSSAMHGLIAMDKQHKPLTHCIIWADTRSESFANQLKATAEGFNIYSVTGTPIHPMSPLCKLGWMRTHLPDVFKATHKFISIKEYIFFKLFGCYVVDESIASATGLFDIHRLAWYAPALNLVGISSEQLSEPVPITHSLSGLSVQWADAMGIPADTPFIIGGSDGCLANLGGNAIAAGDAAVTIGTSGAIRMMSHSPKTDSRARTFSYVLNEKLFVLGGAVNSGGVVLQWYKDQFGQSGLAQAAAYQALVEEADSVPPGSDGLIFLPYLAGERAPHWNAEAKGVFFGVQMHHQRRHFTRAVYEGITYGIYSVGKVLEEIAGPIHTIHANGGFARTPQWVQLLADVFDRKVVVRENVESAAKGAYLVVLMAQGMLSDFEDYEDTSAMNVYLPNSETHRIHMENVGLFERLYDKIKDEF